MRETINIIQDQDALKNLSASWNALESNSRTPLLRHEWFMACAQAFCPPDRLAVIAYSVEGEIAAIAPCSMIRRGKLDRIEILGSSVLCEPTGFLYRDEESLKNLFEGLLAMDKPIVIRRLRADIAERLLEHWRDGERGYLSFDTPSASPWISIESPWPDFERQLSAKRRSTLRRAWRHAEIMGKVRFELITPDEHTLERYLAEFIQVEGASWKAHTKTSVQSNPQLKTFLTLYAQGAAKGKILRMAFLRIGEKAIAALLGVEYANRFWVLKIGFREEAAHCSPGIILIHETIRCAFEKNLVAYEFLGTDEPWIRMWTEDIHSYATLRLYPRSAKALLNLGMDGSSLLLHKALRLEGSI
ncbi:MAG: GNAT family N-acetyltransferase [Ignavibacteriales bacterium]|nr:GNAT family N-acetyltransferase [Ignavibacteriales bacterium]